MRGPGGRDIGLCFRTFVHPEHINLRFTYFRELRNINCRKVSLPPPSLSRSDRRVFHTMGNAATAKKGNELESGESGLFFSVSTVCYVVFRHLALIKHPRRM